MTLTLSTDYPIRLQLFRGIYFILLSFESIGCSVWDIFEVITKWMKQFWKKKNDFNFKIKKAVWIQEKWEVINALL